MFDFGCWIERTRIIFCLALSGLLLAVSFPVNAQQQARIAKIGELLSNTLDRFRDGRKKLHA